MTSAPGRPKKSADTIRHCPHCGEEFTLPEWNKKQFCSPEHARAYSKGKPRPIGRKIEKTCANPDCPLPERKFIAYPSHHYVKTCSRECSKAVKHLEAQKNVRKMSEGECMWFAGLFDGEGSVVQTQRARTLNGSFRIQVSNTVVPLLERITEYTGVGHINQQIRSVQNPRHADCYTWSCAAGEALEILRQVRPWLIVKAERADAVLEGRMFDRQSRWDDIYPQELKMTFLYGTNMELLYNQAAISATFSTTVLTCINTAATILPYQLPALQNIWSTSNMVGKGLMFLAAGGYDCTAAAESLSIQLAFDSAVATPAPSSVTVASIGLCTVPTTNVGQWQAQVWLNCVSTAGTASTWYSNGDIVMGVGNNESGLVPTSIATTAYMWSGLANTTGVPGAVTLSAVTSYFPDLYSKWLGAGGCTITTTQFMCFGLN